MPVRLDTLSSFLICGSVSQIVVRFIEQRICLTAIRCQDACLSVEASHSATRRQSKRTYRPIRRHGIGSGQRERVFSLTHDSGTLRRSDSSLGVRMSAGFSPITGKFWTADTESVFFVGTTHLVSGEKCPFAYRRGLPSTLRVLAVCQRSEGS